MLRNSTTNDDVLPLFLDSPRTENDDVDGLQCDWEALSRKQDFWMLLEIFTAVANDRKTVITKITA